MVSKLNQRQLIEFYEVVDRKPGLSPEDIRSRIAEFEQICQEGAIAEDDPLFLKMKMVVARSLAMDGCFSDSYQTLMGILSVATKLSNQEVQRRTRNNIALVKQAMGEVFDAIELWEELLLEELNVADRVLYSNNLGVAYAKALKPKKAIETYFSALELLQRNNQTDGESDLYNNLANMHRSSQQFEKALLYYEKALSLYEAQDNFERLAMIYNNYCSCYLDMQQPDKADEYGKLALEYYNKYMPVHTRSAVLNNIAAIRSVKGDYPAAEELYRQSLSIAEEFHDQEMQANVLNNLAVLALYQEDFDEAISNAQKAQSIAHQIHHEEIEKISYQNIKDAWQGKRDFAQAYLAQSMEMELERRINQNNTPLDIAQAEADFLQKRLEAQLDIYREQNLALERSNQIIGSKTLELETRNNLLEATNSLMNRIISIIAHDVRGPVATIRQTAELMRKGLLKEHIDDLLKHLHESSEETERLIDELLELARKYKAGLDEEADEFDLFEALRHVIKLAEMVAKSKDIKISLTSSLDSLRIKIARNRLQLIVRNLLSNAVKFSQPCSQISLIAKLEDQFLSICVQDQGMGMNNEQIEKILAGASFSRPGTQNEKGFGMGLVFVLEAVMHTGGRLEIESQPGAGSCFKVIYNLAILQP